MISVIVTVYNKELYIRKCIESIENSTYKDIEVIIVEDCSTDNSLSIIKELMAKYNNIYLIQNTENKGAGFSRNTGIKAAHGEWISLIDADDWISVNYFETYFNKMENDIDIIFGECNCVTLDNQQITYYKRNEQIIKVSSNNIISIIPKYKLQFLNIALIKRKLFSQVEYCIERLIEDTPTCYLLLFHCNKIQLINNNGYFYRQTPSSLVHSYQPLLQQLYYIYNMINVIKYFEFHKSAIAKVLKQHILSVFYKTFTYFNQPIEYMASIFGKNKIDYIIEFLQPNMNDANVNMYCKSLSSFEYINK